ncbi:MAG: hypothetical protein ACK50T_04060 [Sphingobacteriia bacterium]
MRAFSAVGMGVLLVWMVGLPQLLHAQCASCKRASYSLVAKADPTALLRNEYRFTLERTFWDRANLSWSLSGGYLQYNQDRGVHRPGRTADFGQAWGQAFAPGRDPFRFSTAPLFTADSSVQCEEIQSGLLRLALRAYLTHLSPYGFFAELSGSYYNLAATYRAANGQRLGGAVIRAPGVGFALGYQFLTGRRGRGAFDIFGGFDYHWLSRHPRTEAEPARRTATQVRLHAGMQLGIALHR